MERARRSGAPDVASEEVVVGLREPLRALAYPPDSQVSQMLEVLFIGIERELYDNWSPTKTRLPPEYEHRCHFRFDCVTSTWWEKRPTCHVCGHEAVLWDERRTLSALLRQIRERAAGVVVRYPKSIRYIDSI